MTFEERAHNLVSQMTLEEKIGQMMHEAPAIERLGVPEYNWWNEALHGYARSGSATVFPQSIAMAASFDPELLEKVGNAVSDEARAKYNEYRKFGKTDIYQGITLWSPNINIFRDPRWGRGQETYGEDPYLTAIMGTAYVKGLQGYDKVYRKCDATLKHYAVHSGPENIRRQFNAEVCDKDLYETYLYAFKYVIDHADPSAVMTAYNAVNGEPCSCSTRLLDILYNEFGFKGYVVSDCGAVHEISGGHHYAEDYAEGSAKAVNAGCTIECGYAYRELSEAVKRGLVTEETLTAAVEKLFTARYRLGMFDDDCEYNNIPYDVVCSEEHKALNLEMARETMVLLKNDGILPLSKETKVAVIGPEADFKEILLGNYNGWPDDYYTLLRGIKEKCKNVTWAAGCDLNKENLTPHTKPPMEEAIIAAKNADVVILCLGIAPAMEGEHNDGTNDAAANGDRSAIDIPNIQKTLYNEIMAVGKPVVLVNVSGSCINLSREKEECNAILQCFYPGAMGGLALAEIIFGEVSPSGRLPVTFYKSLADLPPVEDYSMEGRTYKFFTGTPVYEFGYGLTYSDVTEDWTDEKTVTVKNNGKYDVKYSVLRFEYIPYKNLCGIKKIDLKAGESVTVSFE